MSLFWWTKMEVSRYCLSPNTQVPCLHRASPTGNYVVVWISRKQTVWLLMTIPTTIIQLARCQTLHNTHLAGKSLFCKLDCSQTYHCLKMAHQRSVEMLEFNFASRTFVYKRLAQSLNRSACAFSSIMREYFDPVVRVDECAQYVNDIGMAANNATDLTRNIYIVFQCTRQKILKLTKEKCHHRVRQFVFPGGTISPEVVWPQAQKIHRFPDKFRFPKSEEVLQRYLRFVNTYRNYLPGSLKNLIHSTNCLKLKYQSILR